MLFNSLDFIIFFPIVFVLYWFVFNKSVRIQNAFVLVASYIFYGFWDWRFLSLIAFSSVVDFFVGLELGKTEENNKRKKLLLLSLLVNLGFLGFFKYFNFFAESFVDAFTLMGVEFSSERLNIILPVGISFYTFQTMSYTIDIYKRNIEPTKDAISFFSFVCFFPQLVAGPIERASNLLPQFYRDRIFSYQKMAAGFKLIIVGFFLKLVLADRAAIYVDAIFNNIEHHEGLSFLAGTFFFAFQIYGDFAGYSLIAIGCAQMLGFQLMTNFKRPYFSASVGEFWNRWHISLSTWFRDYVYIPLGGNRNGQRRWMINIMLTFLLSGFWHGANWTFIFWGGLNGLFLIIESKIFKSKKKSIFRIVLTFFLICFAWLFFRANSLSDAFTIIKAICSSIGNLYIPDGDDSLAPIYAILAIGIVMIEEFKSEYLTHKLKSSKIKNSYLNATYYSFIVFLILYLGVFDNSQFIYFQF